MEFEFITLEPVAGLHELLNAGPTQLHHVGSPEQRDSKIISMKFEIPERRVDNGQSIYLAVFWQRFGILLH